jgi:hypothetical protein
MSISISISEEQFIKLFNKIAIEEFNYDENIPITFENVNMQGGYVYRLRFKDNGKGYIESNKFIFNKKYIDKLVSEKEIIKTIKHELIHWEIHHKKWNDNFKDYFSILVPHDLRFINEARKHKINYLYYVFGGFLENIKWSFLFEVIVKIIKGEITIKL